MVRARIAKTSFKDSRTTSKSIGVPLKREIATTLFSAPSNSRTLATTCWAINNAQLRGNSTSLLSAFFNKISIRVSISGGSTPTDKPHENRETKRGSNSVNSLG